MVTKAAFIDFFGAMVGQNVNFKKRVPEQWKAILQAQARECQAKCRVMGKTLNEFLVASKISGKGVLQGNAWVRDVLPRAFDLWKLVRDVDTVVERLLGKYSGPTSAEAEAKQFNAQMDEAFAGWVKSAKKT